MYVGHKRTTREPPAKMLSPRSIAGLRPIKSPADPMNGLMMPMLDRAVIASEMAEISTPSARANVGKNG